MEEFDHGRYQKAFIVNHSRLVRKLTIPELMEACFSKGLLTLDEKSEIETQRTDTQQLNKLLVIFHRRYVIRPEIFREIFGILKEINDAEGGNIFNHVIQSLQETLENPPEFPTLHDHSEEDCPSLQLYESIIIKTLDVKQILPELISQYVITIEESEAIDNESDFADKARKFLEILTRRGQDSFQRFIQILQETEVYKELAEKLVSGQENDGLLKVKHYVTREQLPELLRVLKEQHHNWFQFGVQLSVQMSKLLDIKNQSIGQSPDVCFPRVLDIFLKKIPEKRKWKDIFQALEFVGKNRIKRELIKQGYQPDSVVTIELQRLSTLLKDVVPDWYMFGQSLEIPTSELKSLRDGKGSDQCFSQMMDEWMEGEHATFEALIEALEHVGNGRLAREVKETYLSSIQAVVTDSIENDTTLGRNTVSDNDIVLIPKEDSKCTTSAPSNENHHTKTNLSCHDGSVNHESTNLPVD